jgi:predicted Rossmann fold flavoprotein
VIFDAIIIGGGAAGLFCAIEAGKRGRKTLVIEHNAQVGKKILISGGGRCNFTNLGTGPENFISENPHFCKSALARFTPEDFVRLIRKFRIDFYEKKLGQLFCRESSRPIVEMLLTECSRAGVEVRTACKVNSLRRRNDEFELETTAGQIRTTAVVIATGGLSYPKIGATDFGYRIAEQFGIERTSTRPSLVALVRAGHQGNSTLAGISLDAQVSAGKHSFRENVLFTHRGLSGPAILQISNYWKRPEPVSIDLLPERNIAELIEQNRSRSQKASNFLAEFLPQRFAERFAAENLPDRPLNKLADREIEKIADTVHDWKVKFVDTEGYGRAEVTLGGVSTRELSSQTMESKKVPGLYFIGEVVDVTGWLGGYNFQWAWASGYAAGSSL